MNNEIDSDLYHSIVETKRIHPNWGRKKIAQHLECKEGCVRRVLNKYFKKELEEIFPSTTTPIEDLQVNRIKEELKNYKKKYVQSLKIIEDLQEQLSISDTLKNIAGVILPPTFEVLPKEPGKAVAITLAGDWHFDEVIDPNSINGVNQFNLEIGECRAHKYFQYVLRLLNMCRTESKIDTLVIGALGDFISGWIHDEFKSTNSLTPPEAIVKLFEVWSGGLEFLLEKGNIKEIIFVGCCGNHTRITDRMQAKQSHKKSYEWILYNFLAKWFSQEKYKNKIRFKLPTGYFNYLPILNKVIRFHHGDNIKYQGGVGGVHIPLRKAIAQWNKAKKADLDVMGHWHTRETSRDYVINGSLIGYNEYAEKIKADFEPPQQSFFLIHPRFGKTAEFPIVLE